MIITFQKIIISFSNLILSLPFTILGLAKFETNEVKADWQPPGYVFGIVWPILYLLFGIINFRTLSKKKSITNSNIINQAVTESILQTLWLFVTANYGGGRNLYQNSLGLIVMIYLVYYCYFVRIPTLKSKDTLSLIMYIPYSLWIFFALILNLQIVINYLK